jgi:hypothetical protein
MVAGPGAGETTLDAFARGVKGDYVGVLDPSPNAAYAGKLLNDVGQGLKQLADQMIGAQSQDEAGAAWSKGDYGLAATREVQAFGEAGLALMGLGATARAAATPATRVLVAVGEYVESKAASFGEPYGLGLRLPVVEGGGIAPSNGFGLVELDPSTIRFT